MDVADEVLFAEMPGQDGHLGIVTLNRPKALNSLNHAMIQALHAQLLTWADDDSIKAVVIKAVEGRAFCAGGDLRLISLWKQQDLKAPSAFFYDEYQLNRFIFHYPKPYIAFLDGITMGGGVGISIHGSHRIATERLLFAMPETGIGFFPDVGGTYFLPRLAGYLGYYLGLTGAKINSDDCLHLGLAQTKITQQTFPILLKTLADTPFTQNAKDDVSEIIKQFHIPARDSLLMQQQATIATCFSLPHIEDIIVALKQEGSHFAQETLAIMEKKSPTSLKVTLRALQLGHQLDFDACMNQEYCLTRHFLSSHDFSEGIRAVIIDKDQKPQWQPNRLAEVKESLIDKYFTIF